MSKFECDWYRIVPVNELVVNAQKVGSSDWSTRGMKYVKRCMD